MSEVSKKALRDPEVRARMSAASKKAWQDPEVRARMSAARKKACQDPEVRARMSAASKKACQDPEVRARMSEARRKMRDYMAARQARVAGDVLGALRRGAATVARLSTDTGWPLETIVAALRAMATAGQVTGCGRPKIWRLADDH